VFFDWGKVNSVGKQASLFLGQDEWSFFDKGGERRQKGIK